MNLHDVNERYARFWFRVGNASGRRRIWLKLARFLGNEVKLLDALGSMHALMDDMGKAKQPVALALAHWIREINNGKSLATALRGWASPEEIMLIAAGEESSKLIGALQSAADIMVARKRISAALYKGLAYPFVLTVAIIGVLYLFSYHLVPTFTQALHHAAWQGAALAMVNVCDFVRTWLLGIVAALLSLVALFFVSLPRFDGRLRIWLDRVPPYSIYRTVHGFSFMIATAALVEAGVKVLIAVEKLSVGTTPWLKHRLDACAAAIHGGLNIGEAFIQTGYDFPDREVITDLGAYAKVKGFDKALAITAREWLEDVVASIELSMKVILGVAVVCLAAVMAFLITGMFSMQDQFATLLQAH